MTFQAKFANQIIHKRIQIHCKKHITCIKNIFYTPFIYLYVLNTNIAIYSEFPKHRISPSLSESFLSLENAAIYGSQENNGTDILVIFINQEWIDLDGISGARLDNIFFFNTIVCGLLGRLLQWNFLDRINYAGSLMDIGIQVLVKVII